MKKQLILAAVAALVVTAYREQNTAPFSTTTTSENRNITDISPSSPEHGGGNASSEAITGEGLVTQLDWSRRTQCLDEALGILDQNQMKCMGVWNVSLEGADLLLEDGTKLIFLNTIDDASNSKGAKLMTIDGQFNNNGFQENYLNQYDVSDSEEYYPETAMGLPHQERLWRYNRMDLSVARNKISAHYGRKYENPFLNVVFSRKSWYQPAYSGEKFNAAQDSVLNNNEKKNLVLLIQMEEERGFRKRDRGGYEQLVPIVNGSWIGLDLDGQKEWVTYQVETNNPYSSEVYKLGVKEPQMRGPGESSYQYPYTASLDGTTTQLIIQQDGPSDGPVADIYVYRGSSLRKADSITSDSIQAYKDPITSRSQHDLFQTYRGMQKCQFSSDTIAVVQEDFYEQNREAFSLAVIPFYVKKEIPDTSITLNPGDKVVILGSDYREWVLIQKEEVGERGWLKCGDEDSPYLRTLLDGSRGESWNLFDGLSFYG